MNSQREAKIFGMRAENYFASLLNKNGIPHEFTNSWFDFLINKKFKVEVKSCRLAVKDGKASHIHYRVGRFDFTKEESRVKQFDENIWVAFILRNEKDFMLLGLCRAKKLNKKRYVNLNDLRRINPLSFEKWLTEVNK